MEAKLKQAAERLTIATYKVRNGKGCAKPYKFDDIMLTRQANLRFDYDSGKITQNDIVVATIERRYSDKKVRLYYPELTPKITWL